MRQVAWSAILATLAVVAITALPAAAFPHLGRINAMERQQVEMAMEQARKHVEMIKRDDEKERRIKKRQTSTPKIIPDPNDAEHRFQEPGPTDQRGPCPGMNTLANHGYLPRSGIVTIFDLIRAQKEGFNIDYDLGAALAAVATSLDGDLFTLKVSLGSADSRTMLLATYKV